MGSPDFSLPTLGKLIESEHEVVGVVCQPDRPAGRGRELRPPPAKELAQEHGLRVLQPIRVNRQEPLDAIRALAPEAIVVAAYGQILKQPLLDIPTRGSLNVHASLLPKYRGAAPAAAAIIAGEETAGVTIMEVILALDAGPILTQRDLPIEPQDTTDSLNGKLSELGTDLLLDTLPRWERGELTPQPQDDAQSIYAPMLTREDAVIDWSLPAADIWRRVRAFVPWPVATTSLNGEHLRILEAWPLDGEPGIAPGTVIDLPTASDAPAGAGFAVRCGQGVLAIVRAQRSGKRPLSGVELLRGYRELIGARLGA